MAFGCTVEEVFAGRAAHKEHNGGVLGLLTEVVDLDIHLDYSSLG